MNWRFKSDALREADTDERDPHLPIRLKARENAYRIVHAAICVEEDFNYLQRCYDLLEWMEPGQRFILTPTPFDTLRLELLIAAVCLVMDAHPDRYTLHENYRELVRNQPFVPARKEQRKPYPEGGMIPPSKA